MGLTIIRLFASGLEALVFARWNLKESGKNIAQYYWMVFHTMAALQLVLAVFRFIQGMQFEHAFAFIVFAGLAYVLMFYVPPYRTWLTVSLHMFEQIRLNRLEEGTPRLVQLMRWRTATAGAGFVALIALFVFRAFFWIGDYFDPLLKWLYQSVNLLYWGLAGIGAALCCVSIFNGSQLLIASHRQRSDRKRMEKELGQRLSKEEYLRRLAAEREKQSQK